MKKLTLALLLVGSFITVSALADDKADALRNMEAEFAKATAEHGHEAYISYFAEDGVEIESGSVATKEDQRKEGPWPAGTSVTWSPTKADISASGDMGYTWGNYEFKTKNADGKEEVEKGIYMTV